MKLETIDTIVRDICALRGDTDASMLYTQVARATKRTVEQLNLHLFPNIVSKPMTVSEKLTIELNPKEVEFVTKIGCEVNGRLDVLPYAENIVNEDQLNYIQNRMEPCECTREEDEEPTDENTCFFCTFHNYHHRNNYYGEYYGYSERSSEKGAWKYDMKTNTIILDSGQYVQSGSTLIVEYKPCLQQENYMMVPAKYWPIIFQRVTQWLEQGQNIAAADFAKREFLTEYDEIKRLDQHFTIENVIAAIQSGIAYTVKR